MHTDGPRGDDSGVALFCLRREEVTRVLAGELT